MTHPITRPRLYPGDPWFCRPLTSSRHWRSSSIPVALKVVSSTMHNRLGVVGWEQGAEGGNGEVGTTVSPSAVGSKGGSPVSASGLEGRGSKLAPPAPQTSGISACTVPTLTGSLPHPNPTCDRIRSQATPFSAPGPAAPSQPPPSSPWAR